MGEKRKRTKYENENENIETRLLLKNGKTCPTNHQLNKIINLNCVQVPWMFRHSVFHKHFCSIFSIVFSLYLKQRKPKVRQMLNKYMMSNVRKLHQFEGALGSDKSVESNDLIQYYLDQVIQIHCRHIFANGTKRDTILGTKTVGMISCKACEHQHEPISLESYFQNDKINLPLPLVNIINDYIQPTLCFVVGKEEQKHLEEQRQEQIEKQEQTEERELNQRQEEKKRQTFKKEENIKGWLLFLTYYGAKPEETWRAIINCNLGSVFYGWVFVIYDSHYNVFIGYPDITTFEKCFLEILAPKNKKQTTNKKQKTKNKKQKNKKQLIIVIE